MRFNQPLNYPGKIESLGRKINCAICGKEITKRSHRQKYCKECAETAKRKYSQEYYELHKKEKVEYVKNYLKTYPEKARKASRKYYQKNKEACHLRHKKWAENNREYLNNYKKFYRCSKKYNNCDDCPYDDYIKE